MNNVCANICSTHVEKQRCSGQLRLPQTPVEAKKWTLDAEKKNNSHYKFQCNYEERRQKAEAKKKKLIQKLKFEHQINVDELSNHVLENILLQAEILDKQKRMREKEKVQRRFHFISRLAQEEKYKCRDSRSPPVLQKKVHKVRQLSTMEAFSVQTDESEKLNPSLIPEVEGSEESEDEIQLPEENPKAVATEESESNPTQCYPKESQESILPPEFFPSPKETKATLSAELNETCLKCIPDCVIFENCKANKTYIQTYKISNIGFDDIHCRYVGIETENDKIPIRVEMTDSALLRPGLSFVGKVKMVSSDEVTEFNGFLLYETRRKKNPNKKACFRIPLKCLRVRSIVEVSPNVIRFPPVSWCTATGKERTKHMRRTIKIKNFGGKDCSCSIARFENVKESSTTSTTCIGEGESVKQELSFESSNSEQHPRESCYFIGAYEEALTIMSELLDNVFEVFRFSRKYHIPLPAMSTVEIDLDFLPEYRGYHHEVALVRFDGADNCIEEKLEMSGEIKKIPLRVEPSTIDLKICIINSGLYEGTFKVFNESNSPITVNLKVPGSMKQHSLVFPTSSIIQPRSYHICSVRLFPRPSISNDAFKYYKEETKVLEFPIFIHPLGKDTCKWDRIKLYVFAILTNHDLELQPSQIDFGLVTTLETIRTQISLINHSMCPQEFGFLHLPKGVRIEPNYGFGTILPKETIPLYLLYSPVLSCVNNQTEEGDCTFRVEVTSLAKLCRFSKHLQEPPEPEPADTICGEEPLYNTEADETPQESLSLKDSQVDEDEEEEEEEESSLTDDGDGLRILQNKQKKIRDYINQNKDSYSSLASTESTIMDERDLSEENECSYARNSPREDKWTLTCKAVVIKPFCELSSSVIQLPATPMSSVSVTRFRINTNLPEKCNCNFMGKLPKKNGGFFFEAFFEFHTPSTLITIEPQTGHIIRGQSLPIAIIFRPEFSKDELIYRSKVLNTDFLFEEPKPKHPSPPLKLKSKTHITKPIREASRNQSLEMECQDGSMADLEIGKCDMFVGEKGLQRMLDPFHLEFEVVCIMKILPCQGVQERIERHSLRLIAPVIKPSCVLLGKSQEISFGKVAVGDSARKIIEIQNTSLSRISPRISALNPHGPFTCATCTKMDKIDPEHIWRHPITFSPTAEKGKETEFFEVRHGVTIIPLAVNGEGITPKYTFSPDFTLCVLETYVDVIAELEFMIENFCEAALRFQFVLDFIKKRSNYKDESALFETNGSRKSEVTLKRSERKMNQMTKDGSKRIVLKSEFIPEVASQLETEFVNVENLPSELFTIVGLDKKNEVCVNPSGKSFLKVKFSPAREIISNSLDENSPLGVTYAAGYKIMLSRTILKNLTIIGIVQLDK